MTREEFVVACPWPFLIGETAVVVPKIPMKTMVSPALRPIDTLQPEPPDQPEEAVLVLPIRKRQNVFPEMITLGRTANHDVVINDATISKFHAFFRTVDDKLEVVDAGSRNGTKVMGRALTPRVPAPVSNGSRIRFGTIDLVLQTAREAWDALRIR